jgi:hypothetical protein
MVCFAHPLQFLNPLPVGCRRRSDTMVAGPMPIDDVQDWKALREAVEKLETPSFIIEVANFIGLPVNRLVQALPERFAAKTQQVTQRAIDRALSVAVRSLANTPNRRNANRMHTVAAAISGGVGGSLGLATTLAELPFTTVLILRSIADIARRENEDLSHTEARLACLEVFALGGSSTRDDASETGYFAVRAALSKAVSDAARFLAERGLAEKGAPVLVRFIAQVAARFGIVVSEKAAAQALPIVGAAGGAAVNVLFMQHFQKMAEGHFTIRRLERKYGPEVVREEYERFRGSRQAAGLIGDWARPA